LFEAQLPLPVSNADTMDKLGFEFMAEVVESLVIFFLSHQ
jgi:hypothetical protein